MCGRFTLRAPASTIAEQFQVLDIQTFEPRFNVAPTQPVAAVRLPPESGRRQFAWLKWGLVPSWVKDPAIGNRLINARAETLAEKPAFRAAFRQRRCLVVADGFYEWRRTGGCKQPYFIRLHDERPFAFAGLWESWEGKTAPGRTVPGTVFATDLFSSQSLSAKTVPGAVLLETCTLITTGPNELMEPIHDRMPVILSPADYDRWLDPAIHEPDKLLPLLRPYPADAMLAVPVSVRVNNPKNDDAECVAPAA
jgi:putative SOS response-associated peptidase YedK